MATSYGVLLSSHSEVTGGIVAYSGRHAAHDAAVAIMAAQPGIRATVMVGYSGCPWQSLEGETITEALERLNS